MDQSMTFKRFWCLYLQGHSMPGTRTIHYFATLLGLLCALEVVVSRQPVFAFGIALAYALAIGAHRFIERNAPLIKVNPFWGMVADVRMCWLAISGQLSRELKRAGVPANADSGSGPARLSRGLRRLDIATAVVATLGLAWAASDLADLFEPQPGYAFVPLGVPIVAFCAATAAAFGTLAVSRRRGFEHAEQAAWSLRRASIVLLIVGALSFAAAEIFELGDEVEQPDVVMLAAAAIVAVVTVGALLVVVGGRRYASDPAEAFGASVVKLAGFLGSIGAMAAGLGALCWQSAPIIGGGVWRSLSIGDLLEATPGHSATVAWFLAAPAWLGLCMLGAALLGLAFVAADRELKRRAERLYALYLAQVRRTPPRD